MDYSARCRGWNVVRKKTTAILFCAFRFLKELSFKQTLTLSMPSVEVYGYFLVYIPHSSISHEAFLKYTSSTNVKEALIICRQ